MHTSHNGWLPRVFAVFALVALWTGCARAAGEWEWTEGQGWVMGAGVSRPTPKEQLHYAYELEQRGEFMNSARQYFLLVQNFPDSQEAGIGLQRLARCLFEMENYYTSYKAIEQVIETYPATGRMSDLVEIELRIAKKMMVSQTPDILSGRNESSRDFNIRRALEIIDSVIEHDPYGPVAAEAWLVKGEGHLFIGEINDARRSFEVVRDEFPRSDFVERARLGILQCDNLVGQASPQEVQEQMDVVRETESKRQRERTGMDSELDDVDGSLRKLTEVEAEKMMEQARQYRQMGTREAVNASKFLYGEIVRRFPGSPQAEEAMAMVDNIKVPKEQSRYTKPFRNLKLNPFTWNKDPEPPWIVPQMDPEEMVMVDPAMGPIRGVAETGIPQTSASAGVRPAALREQADAALNGDPRRETAATGLPAPAFVDGAGVGEARIYTSAPPPPYPEPAPYRAPNPIPTISEDELIPFGGSPAIASAQASNYQSPGVYSSGPIYQQTPAPVPAQAPLPEIGPSNPSAPTFGGLDYESSMNDLVGPAPRRAPSAPQPYYGGAPQANQYDPYAMPAPPANAYDPYAMPAQPSSSYDPYAPAQPSAGYQTPGYAYQGGGQPSAGYVQQSGGWTLEDDFR